MTSLSLQQRRRAQAKYRPSRTKLLIIAEAPPKAVDRYFYFEHVTKHDSLFRHVWEALTGEKPDRQSKAKQLARLRTAGVYLIDVFDKPVTNCSKRVPPKTVDRLVRRCKKLQPRHIVLVKVNVYKRAFDSLARAGLPVINARIPFPGSGRQKEFLRAFRRVVAKAGISLSTAAR